MIGLNFADEGEAENFNRAISERLAAKQRKKEGKGIFRPGWVLQF